MAIARSKAGMTLVELLVAMACLAIVMGAVYQMFWGQSKIATAEQQILELQRNARVASERLSFLIANAGFGCSGSFPGSTLTGDDPDGGTIAINSVVSDIVNVSPGNGSDSVVFTLGFKKVAEVDGGHNQTNSIDFKNVGTPSITTSTNDFKNNISFYPNINGNLVYTVIDASDPYEVDSEVAYLGDGSSVFMVSPVRVKKQGNELYLQNFSYSSSQFWSVAKNLENIQFQYTEDGNGWKDVPDDIDNVIGVKYFLLFKSGREDPGYRNTNNYTMAGVTLPKYNDAYHRYLTQETVWIRNAQ